MSVVQVLVRIMMAFVTAISLLISASAAVTAILFMSTGPDVVVGESDGYLDIPITLSAPGTTVARAYYNVASGTAVAGSDFSCPNPGCAAGTVVFEPGQTLKTVRIPLLNDTTKEPLETFTFSIYSPTGSTASHATTSIGIVDNDTVVTRPALYIRDATVDESVNTVFVPVILGGPAGTASAHTVTVHYATADGTALAGSDYTANSGTLSFAPGQTVKYVPLRITNDTTAETAESLRLNLSTPVNAVIADGSAVITIGRNDAAKSAAPFMSTGPDVVVGESDGYLDIPITLSAPGTTVARAYYNVASGTAVAGSDFSCPNPGCAAGTVVFEPGQTLKTVRIPLLNDTTKEPLETFTFSIYSPTGSTASHATTSIGIAAND